jgi:tetratricopeptide (TPR) repeat protein
VSILKLRFFVVCVVVLIAVTVLPGCRLIPTRSPKTDLVAESRNLWSEGIMLQERGDHRQAENSLAEAVALNEKDADIRRSYAEVLWLMGKKQDSMEQLSEALTLAGKSDTRILLSLSEKCYDLGEHAAAVDVAEKAIDSADAKWASTEENRLLISRAWVIRARVHWRNNELPPALNDYHKAISLCPKDRELLSELATLQGELGQPERALATWHSVSRLWPIDQEPKHVVFGRGEAYMAMRQYHLACDQFADANQRWPEDINTYCQLAKAQLAGGRPREAAIVAQRAVEIAPENSACLAGREQVRVALAQQQQVR